MKITNSSDSEEDVKNYNELINQIITETNNYTVKKKMRMLSSLIQFGKQGKILNIAIIINMATMP